MVDGYTMEAIERSDETVIAAQQRTIEVLRSKVYDLYNTQEGSMIHKALDAARKRVEEAQHKRQLMEQQNKILEDVVKQRTRQLQQKTND